MLCSFPVPLKQIDVTRTTHTIQDVMQEKRINSYWNVDGNRTLSDSWTGFTKFTVINENLLQDTRGPGRRLRKIQATARPENLWPEIWTGMSQAAKKQERKWAMEKPKLENARKLRGFFFIDPEGEEH